MDVVLTLEERLIPAFHKIKGELTFEFPNYEFDVISCGGADESWHSLSLVCYFDREDLLDKVGIQIDGGDLDTHKQTLQAEVRWDMDWAHEIKLFPEPVRASPEAILQIEKSLPKLVDAFKTAIKRGHRF